jgi:hypothetical protein
MWSLSWQMIWLAAGVSWFMADWAEKKTSVLSVSGLVGGVILSRIGLWSYDLAAQNIIQDVRCIPDPLPPSWISCLSISCRFSYFRIGR